MLQRRRLVDLLDALMLEYMKRRRVGVRVLSARSATTGGGMALVANCAAERSRAIVCRGGVLWGSWATGQRGAKARGNEVPMHGATRCQKTGQRGAEERGNDVPMHSNWWAGSSRTGVESGVLSTGAPERCRGAEHYW